MEVVSPAEVQSFTAVTSENGPICLIEPFLKNSFLMQRMLSTRGVSCLLEIVVTHFSLCYVKVDLHKLV